MSVHELTLPAAPLVTPLLSVEEENRLRDCERVIERGQQTFIEVAEAVRTIRNERLYRETHASFEAYVLDRWNVSKTHANRMVAAAELVAELAPIGVSIENENQARLLGHLDTQTRQEAVALARQGKGTEESVTAREVIAAANALDTRNAPRVKTPLAEVSSPPEPTVIPAVIPVDAELFERLKRAYSADTIAPPGDKPSATSRIQSPILVPPHLYTIVGIRSGGSQPSEALGYKVIDPRLFKEPARVYDELVDANGRGAMYYHGLRVAQGIHAWILAGPEVTFRLKGSPEATTHVQNRQEELRPDSGVDSEGGRSGGIALAQPVAEAGFAVLPEPVADVSPDAGRPGTPLSSPSVDALEGAQLREEPEENEEDLDAEETVDAAWHDAFLEAYVGVGGNLPEFEYDETPREFWVGQFRSYLEICAEQSGYIFHLEAVRRAAEGLAWQSPLKLAPSREALETALQTAQRHIGTSIPPLNFLERALGAKDMALLRRLSEGRRPLVGELTPADYLSLMIRQRAQQAGIEEDV